MPGRSAHCGDILWDAQTGEAERRMRGAFQFVGSLAFSVDEVRLACGILDGSVYVSDATTGALLCCWMSSWGEKVVAAEWVQFSPVNNSILATVSNNMITLWDVDTASRKQGVGLVDRSACIDD